MEKSRSKCLVVRGLQSNTTEASVYAGLSPFLQLPDSFEYIRIIRDKAGNSKGIAVLCCHDKEVASSLQPLSGRIYVDGFPVAIEFGHDQNSDDWKCQYCSVSNYHWRNQCFKCLVLKGSAKPAIASEAQSFKEQTISGSQDISTSPTKFLLLQSLNSIESAEFIYESIKAIDCEILRIWLAIDKQTNTSREFAFIQYPDEAMATKGLDKIFSRNRETFPEFTVSFGRDLQILNSLYIKDLDSRKFSHWDPLIDLVPYPVPEMEILSTHPAIPKAFSFKASGFPSVPQKSKIQFIAWSKPVDQIPNQKDPQNEPCNISPQLPSITTRMKCFLDPILLACLLCKKDFETESEFQEHKFNDDHLMKLECYRELAASYDLETIENQPKRDRAAERRSIFHSSERIKHKSSKNKEEEEGFGAKLLRKHGWTDGEGLGSSKQGITEPIQARKLKRTGAGLGSSSIITHNK